jgi:hypothetical protein
MRQAKHPALGFRDEVADPLSCSAPSVVTPSLRAAPRLVAGYLQTLKLSVRCGHLLYHTHMIVSTTNQPRIGGAQSLMFAH